MLLSIASWMLKYHIEKGLLKYAQALTRVMMCLHVLWIYTSSKSYMHAYTCYYWSCRNEISVMKNWYCTDLKTEDRLSLQQETQGSGFATLQCTVCPLVKTESPANRYRSDVRCCLRYIVVIRGVLCGCALMTSSRPITHTTAITDSEELNLNFKLLLFDNI